MPLHFVDNRLVLYCLVRINVDPSYPGIALQVPAAVLRAVPPYYVREALIEHCLDDAADRRITEQADGSEIPTDIINIVSLAIIILGKIAISAVDSIQRNPKLHSGTVVLGEPNYERCVI